jgi:hypothetical protein
LQPQLDDRPVSFRYNALLGNHTLPIQGTFFLLHLTQEIDTISLCVMTRQPNKSPSKGGIAAYSEQQITREISPTFIHLVCKVSKGDKK